MSGLSPSDQALFERFGQGPAVAPPHLLVHRAFEAHAAVAPDAIAVEHLGASITYGELDRQANRVAALLIEHGVAPGDNVALFLQRSIPMIVGILGALKAGASYVPQHVGVAPEAHLAYVIETARTRVILTLSHLRDAIPVPDGHVCIDLDQVMRAPLGEHDDDGRVRDLFAAAPALEPSPDNTCYIIFTSGTTGNPNGVQVTHRNVCNILLTAPGDLGIRPGMRVGQILSIGFDMAAWEILGCLANGATLVIRGREFGPVVENVDVIIATPSILASFDPDRCRGVQVVAVAGEPCPRPLADRWAQFTRFYNSCGPTETTIVNTAQHYRPGSERLTIGAPTPNNTVYVLDADRKPCAIGEIGEMWAGGDCVSAGYIGNEALTRERYAPDPFLGGERMMFRTRDLGRWTPDGELEHLGRTDDQVKVRGFRVELDSVSAALESVPSCEQAVTLKLDPRNLVAFVHPSTVDVAAARRAVAAALPYYCVPAFVLALDAFPKTSRGKVDKRALLALAETYRATVTDPDGPANDERRATVTDHVAPANDERPAVAEQASAHRRDELVAAPAPQSEVLAC
ncbi:amino acid adenylation domain-containing protein [Haliangium sp.]|uniref:amino acid adenylation domain-containing protein n=1 Tax=Haliangium sp. TaxID=2663208 RepID=UPI003D0964C4